MHACATEVEPRALSLLGKYSTSSVLLQNSKLCSEKFQFSFAML